MSSFAIKLIAIITMTIDHIGYHLITTPAIYLISRAIGRITFPLFCFILTNSYRHTSNKLAYLIRLSSFALLFEFGLFICYLLTDVNYLISINVFLTLVSCLISLILFDSKHRILQIIGIIFIILISYTPIDYGIYGILLVLIFYYIPAFWQKVSFFILLNAFFIHISPFMLTNTALHFSPIQWFSLLSLIPIYFYNNTRGKKLKYFFYFYYPLSSLFIWLFSYFIP